MKALTLLMGSPQTLSIYLNFYYMILFQMGEDILKTNSSSFI